jgi:hypothetical protein
VGSKAKHHEMLLAGLSKLAALRRLAAAVYEECTVSLWPYLWLASRLETCCCDAAVAVAVVKRETPVLDQTRDYETTVRL